MQKSQLVFFFVLFFVVVALVLFWFLMPFKYTFQFVCM